MRTLKIRQVHALKCYQYTWLTIHRKGKGLFDYKDHSAVLGPMIWYSFLTFIFNNLCFYPQCFPIFFFSLSHPMFPLFLRGNRVGWSRDLVHTIQMLSLWISPNRWPQSLPRLPWSWDLSVSAFRVAEIMAVCYPTWLLISLSDVSHLTRFSKDPLSTLVLFSPLIHLWKIRFNI